MPRLLDFSIEIYSHPIYKRGSGPPMMPITLAPPHKSPIENEIWLISDKIIGTKIDGVIHNSYIIYPKENPAHRREVLLEDILDWVSHKVYEDFEFELSRSKDRAIWEQEDKILSMAEEIRRNRSGIGNQANEARSERNRRKEAKSERKKIQLGYSPPKGSSHTTGNEVKVTGDAQGRLITTATSSTRKRKRTQADSRNGSSSKQPSLYNGPHSSPQSLSESARQIRAQRPLFHSSITGSNKRVDGASSEGGRANEVEDSRFSPPLVINALSHSVQSTITSRSQSSSRSRSRQSHIEPASGQRGARSQSRASTRSESPAAEKGIRRDHPKVQGSPELDVDWSRIPEARDRRRSSIAKEARFNDKLSTDHEKAVVNDGGNVKVPVDCQSSPRKSTASLKRNKRAPYSAKKGKKSRKQEKTDDEDVEWTVKEILNHEYRTVDGKRVLYYLIDWECDYDGQWEPTWEPADLVGEVSKGIYFEKIAVTDEDDIPIDARNVQAVAIKQKNGTGNHDFVGEGDRNGNDDHADAISPSAQLLGAVLRETRLEVEAPIGSDDDEDETLEAILGSQRRREVQVNGNH